jgi:hypothetical protein
MTRLGRMLRCAIERDGSGDELRGCFGIFLTNAQVPLAQRQPPLRHLPQREDSSLLDPSGPQDGAVTTADHVLQLHGFDFHELVIGLLRQQLIRVLTIRRVFVDALWAVHRNLHFRDLYCGYPGAAVLVGRRKLPLNPA